MNLKRERTSLFFFLISGFLQVTNISSMVVYVDKYKTQSYPKQITMYKTISTEGLNGNKVDQLVNQDKYKVRVSLFDSFSEPSKELVSLKRYLRANPFIPIPFILLLGLLPIVFLKTVIGLFIGNILLLKLELKKKAILLNTISTTSPTTVGTTEAPIIIRLYDHPEFFEDIHVLQVMLSRTECFDIPDNAMEFIDGVTGIKTNGQCITLFAAHGCTGEHINVTADLDDLSTVQFDNITKSLRIC